MLTTTRTNFDRRELRRDRRYPLPPVLVTLAGRDYTAVNWSLGGFLLAAGPELLNDEVVTGKLRFSGKEDEFDIAAEALRFDPETNSVAFRFVEPSAVLVDALDRCVANYMLGRRR
jgi:hypothetical protein